MNSKTLIIKILSPEKTLYDGEASAIFLPGELGPFEVLNNHCPIISTLIEGKITIRTQEGLKVFQVREGVVKVKDNNIVVCVD